MRNGNFTYITEQDVYSVLVTKKIQKNIWLMTEKNLVNDRKTSEEQIIPQGPLKQKPRDFTYGEIFSGYT